MSLVAVSEMLPVPFWVTTMPLAAPDGKDTILLKNASVGGLHAHDFILPAGGG